MREGFDYQPELINEAARGRLDVDESGLGELDQQVFEAADAEIRSEIDSILRDAFPTSS